MISNEALPEPTIIPARKVVAAAPKLKLLLLLRDDKCLDNHR
jgi:hypothetical protein